MTRPLNEMLPDLLKYINDKSSNTVDYNKKLSDIYDGQLLPYVEDSLRSELNPTAFERSKSRIAPINVLPKVVDKLSGVYVDPPIRSSQLESDKELVNYYTQTLDLASVMTTANKRLNLHKYCALEPYIHRGTPRLRVISAENFLVYTEDQVNDTEVEVFIKFVGTIKKNTPYTDKEGRVIKGAGTYVKEVALYHIYSDTEFMSVDAEGDIEEHTVNPYGKIPFIYIRKDSSRLVPLPDSDMLPMALLIPKLLADINYSSMFSNRSMVYTVNLDTPANVEFNPDTLLQLESVDDGSGKTPQIGVITPSADVTQSLNSVTSQLHYWLDSKGIKSSASSTSGTELNLSGVAKLIDEADVTNERKKQVRIFQKVERELWELIKVMHNVWLGGSLITGKNFSHSFQVEVTFHDQKVIVDRKTLLEEFKIEKELGIFDPIKALKKLNPELSEAQVQDMYGKINSNKPTDNTPNQ